MDETFLAYLAGFIDGEGCFGLYQNGSRLTVANADRETLEWFVNTTGLGVIAGKLQKSDKHRPCYLWTVQADGLRQLIPVLLPYLRTKKRDAEILLEYLQSVTATNGYNLSAIDRKIKYRLLLDEIHRTPVAVR